MSNLNKMPLWVDDRLDDLFETLANIVQQNQRPPHQVIMSDKEVMAMLNICKRTLATLRERGILPYSKTLGKIHYRLSDILDMIEANKVSSTVPAIRIGINSNYKK